MAEELYDEFADIPALEEQRNKILAIFKQIKDGLASFKDLGIKIDGARGVKDFSASQEQYNAYVKQTQNLIKQLADSEAKLALIRQKETLQLTENRQRIKELNKEQAERLRLQNAEKGSIEQLELQYAKAYRIFKQLSETQRESGRGQTLNKYLEDTSNKLNELKKSAGNFSSNVGRYAGSLAKPFETLINKVDELKANLSKGIGIGGSDEASLKRAAQAITIIENTLESSSAAGTTTVKQVKNLGNAFTDLSVTIGKADSSTFLSNLGLQIGEAKDEAADLKDQLKLNASDTKGIDNAVGSLNALAGIAQGAAGAYALLGANQEDAAKVTSKLIAVQGIANSIQQVGAELTRKGTIANKVYEFSLNTMTTAFGVGSTAAQRFNAILKVGIVGLVVTGLVLLINKLVEYRKATDEAAKASKDLQEIRAEGLKNANEELVKVKLLYEATQNQSLAYKQRKKAVDELQEQYPSYFKNLSDEEILAGNAAKAYDLLTKNILKTGLAQAAKQRITEISSEMLDDILKVEEANKRIDAIIKQGVAVQDKFDVKTLASGNKVNVAPIRISVDEKDKEKAISAVKTTYSEAFKAVEDGNARIKAIIDGIGASNLVDGLIGDPKAAEKAKKIADDTAQEILKTQFEINKLRLQQAADFDKQVFEDETRTFDDRINALREFTLKQMALVELERNFELQSEELKLKGIIDSLEEQKKEKGANIKDLNEQEAKEREASAKRIELIELKGANDLLKVGTDFNRETRRLKDERQNIRDEERKQIEDYNEWTLNEEKRLRNLLIEERKKADKEISDAEDKAIEDRKEKTKQLYSEVLETISFFLTASIDKEIAALDTKKRLLDEETQRRINQINMLGLAETDRIKQVAMVEKQADFEKRQIEARQRKLAVERAKYEKAANIASIIGNTAAAVVKALKDAPYPYNIALAAIIGATGALQLARAIAAPLPQYRTGTSSAKKGLALVSEEGSELMKRNGQLFLTPSTPTLMEMAGGEQITPAHLTRDIINSVNFSKHKQSNGLVLLQPSGMSSGQADTLISEIKDLKRETSRNRIALHVAPGVEWDAYYIQNIKR